MGAPEPERPAMLEPLPLPPYEPPAPTAPLTALTRLLGAGEVAVTRYAGGGPLPAGAEGDAHTVVHEDTRDAGQLALADVVFRHGTADDPRLGSPADWTAEVLARYPQCALAVYVTGPHDCVVRTRAGRLFTLRGADADPVAYACALYAWLAAGKSPEELGGQGLTVRTGRIAHRVRVD
jgi:hypothetical protein